MLEDTVTQYSIQPTIGLYVQIKQLWSRTFSNFSIEEQRNTKLERKNFKLRELFRQVTKS